MDLQHGGSLGLAHAVLRSACVRPFILLLHAEQTQVVAVADLKPGNEKNTDNERSNREEKCKNTALIYKREVKAISGT